MSYAAEHASAKADIAAAGFALTFTRESSDYDEATDTESNTTSASWSGVALRKQGDARVYEALGLTQKEPITLLYATNSYGDAVPPLGATTAAPALGGATYTVRSVSPLAPDGSAAIIVTIVVSR